MKLATVRPRPNGPTMVGRVDANTVTIIRGSSTVGNLLQVPDWQARASRADGPTFPVADVGLGPLVPAPSKVVCVGLNYRSHIMEMGRDLPEYPTLFAKFADALIGPDEDIELPPVSQSVDWEGELVVVVGRSARGVTVDEAPTVIAGYTVMNDISMRDYQFRTREWLQGKTFERTTPVGPVLVTADEWQPGPTLRTVVDGEVVQEASTDDLVFPPAVLVSYVSTIVTLRSGDLIATGTPGGVGHARTPPRYLRPGSLVQVSIDGIGTISNRCIAVDTRGRRANQS